MLGDRLRQLAVLGRINHINAASQDRQRAPAVIERGLMGFAINPARQPAHNRNPISYQVGDELPRYLSTIRTGAPRADYGN